MSLTSVNVLVVKPIKTIGYSLKKSFQANPPIKFPYDHLVCLDFETARHLNKTLENDPN